MVHLALAARVLVHVVAETAKSPLVVMTMLVSVADWLLLSVKVFGLLVLPTFSFANFALAGLRLTAPMPVPESVTNCGLFGALSLTMSPPITVPGSLGVKVIFTLHFLPTASVVLQVVEATAKLALVAMVPTVSVAVPVFVRVTVFGLLVVLMS